LSGKTIVQVIPNLSAGGAERTTIEIAEAMTAAGGKSIVISAGGRLEGELTRAGGTLIKLDNAGTKSPFGIYANAGVIAKVARQHGAALIHARSRAPAWSAMWAANRLKLPFVTTYHGIYNAKSGFKRWYNSVMARGEVVIANSEFTAEHIRKEHPSAKDRIVVIPRGVDIEKFDPVRVIPTRKAAVLRQWILQETWHQAETQPEEGRPAVILLPARMTGWKGHREAVAAAAILAGKPDLPVWRMIFAGDAQGRSSYLEELRTLISQNNLDGRVSIVGHCDDMPAAFALSDIVIAPSNEPEAFGRVAAEAGAMGAPVIGSSIGAQGEIIVAGKTGDIVPPGDPPALAAAIEAMLRAGPEGRKTMGLAAQQRVREKFTTSALQQATLGVYERLIGRTQ
jgi:glycosyltransferase involved in cell wall biosynthesis